MTDICKKAGVARVTFYKYYSTTNDVMRATVDNRVDYFAKRIAGQDPHTDLQIIIEYVIEVLDYSEEILENITNSNMSGILLDYINYGIEIMTQEDVKNNKISRTQVLFLAGGVFNIIHDWVKRGSKESPQLLAQELIKLIPNTLME